MKKQLSTGSKIFVEFLMMAVAMAGFHPAFAQTQTPEISVTIFRDLVRFAAPSNVQEMRVEMFNSTGENIYDSNFVAGQTQDWLLQDLQGRTVDSGLYAYTVTVKDQAGILKQMQRGNVIVDREREGIEAAPPIERSQARPSENQPQPTSSWDVEHGKNPYVINTPAMGVGTQNPLTRLQIGAGTVEPVTKGSTLLLEEGAATGMVLKSTTGGEMFFSQDKKYGLFGTASNHPLGIRTNNQNRFWITDEGKVGIGTINPGSPLTVAGVIETTSGGIKFPDGTVQTTAANGGDGATADPPRPAVKNGAGSSGKNGVKPAGIDGNWSLKGNSGTDPNGLDPNFLGTTDPQSVGFRTNRVERMRIDGSTGNVGIGNQSPPETLGVGGRIHVAGRCGGAFPNVQGAYLSWNQLCGTGETDFVNHQGFGGGGFAFMNTPNGTGLSTLMLISGGGNVGVSTTNPQAKLDIASGSLHIGGGGIIPNLQGAHVSWNLLTGGTGETDFINHQGLGGGGFAFMNTPNGTSRSTLMFVSGNGNVGIGTTNPQGKLDVNGTGAVRARVNSDVNSGLSLSLQGNPEWSVASVVQGDPEFPSRDFVIQSDRLGREILTISQFGTIFANAPLGVNGSLDLRSNRTVISGFDDPVGLTGFHWFGPAPDTDLAFGIKRLGVNKYEFHFNGPIFKRGGGVSFVEDHPSDPSKEIVYVALEGPENGTYTRGAAQLINGVAVIDLADHFGMVTNDDGLTVQLTPRGTWLRLYLDEVSAKQIIVREEGGKSGNFDYLVQGVRKGYENHQVIRDKQKQ